MTGSKLARVLVTLFILAAAWGCAKKESAEVTQQKTEMTQDVQTWRNAVAQWDNEHAQLRAWVSSNPKPPAGSDTTGFSELGGRLQRHEDDVNQFKQSLADHEAKMQDPKADHEALWADHLRLRAQYEMITTAHQDLAREHARLSGDTTGVSG